MYNNILSDSPKHFWDLCKNKIRSSTKEFTKGSQKTKKHEMVYIEKKLQNLYNKCVNSPNDDNIKLQYHNCKLEYELLYSHFMKGLQIRSKEKWVEEGEKCTKYFLNLEKNRGSQKSINKLRCKNGTVTTDQSTILNEEVDYFSDLYKSKINVSNNKLDDFFSDTIFPSLSNEEKESCEGILTEDECLNALNTMANNKSPGYSGLTVEFYRKFWPKIGQIVVNSLNDAYHSGSFTVCQNRGILSLIHKGKGLDRDNLDNWRPIALLNIDYKITTKVLSLRVQKIMKSIINSDQNGFVKGRSIHENIRLIEDVLRYVDSHNLPGIMICIDFKKAFDSIERDYIFYALKKLNFGNMFLRWMSVIFNNATNCVINNGHVSKFFNVDRGVRQGCPIASLIYVLSTEPLACKLRQSKEIKGIHLPLPNYERNEARISSFADDTTLFVETPNCVVKVLKIFEDFKGLSGLSINHTKTDGVYIGSLKNSLQRVGNINWKFAPNNTVKILGVTFSPSIPSNNLPCNWEDRMSKIERSIRAWKARGLSMIGRNIVVKTLLASQLAYIGTTTNIPEREINKLNKMLINFIWGREEAVKRNTVIADFDKGGINMFNIKMFLDSLKMSWIKRLSSVETAVWKNIPLYYIKKLGMDLNVFNCNCNFNQINSKCKNIINGFPSFYYNLLKIWFDTKDVQSKSDMSTNHNQVIWNNNIVKLNHKTLFFSDWICAGFIFISDLFNHDGSFITIDALNHRDICTGNALLKYFALYNAIPSEWKTLNPSNIADINIAITFNSVPIDACSPKIFRKAMINNAYVKPTCIDFWSNKLPNHTCNWENIWLAVPNCTSEAKLITLNWKILHNIYPTKFYLHKIGKENTNICSTCNVIDYVDHFFFNCTKIRQIWNVANQIISSNLATAIQLTVENVLLNYHDNNSKFINHVITVGKMCISKFKYGNHPNLLFLFEKELRLRGLIAPD